MIIEVDAKIDHDNVLNAFRLFDKVLQKQWYIVKRSYFYIPPTGKLLKFLQTTYQLRRSGTRISSQPVEI